MKWLHHIMAFYLVLLSVVPCCAFDDCPEDKAATSQSANHEEGDEDCGSCSPFFNCEGCASVTVDIQVLSFDIAQGTEEKIYKDFILSCLSAIQYDFWQPPRLERFCA